MQKWRVAKSLPAEARASKIATLYVIDLLDNFALKPQFTLTSFKTADVRDCRMNTG